MEKRTTILSEGAVADLTGCGKSLNRDDSPPQGLKPSLVLHDLRGAKAPLYHSAAGFRDFFRSLLGSQMVSTIFPNIWLFSMCSCAARMSFKGNVRSTTGFRRPAKTCVSTSYNSPIVPIYEPRIESWRE